MRRICVIGLSAVGAMSSSNCLAGDWTHSANITLITDYTFRGISQSDKGPAIQGGFDVENGQFYAGAWASSVDFGDDTTMELDLYGGVAGGTDQWSWDVGVIYYAYPDSPELPTGSQEFIEAYAGVAVSALAGEIGLNIALSPEYYGETGQALYVQGTYSRAVAENVSLDLGYGASRFDNEILNDNYEDLSVGITFSTDPADFTFQYVDTYSRQGTEDDAFIFSIGKTL